MKAGSKLYDAWESVFFDLDGVIIKSHPAILRALNDSLRLNALPQLSEVDGLAAIGTPVGEIFSKLARANGANPDIVVKCINEFRTRYDRSFMDGTIVQPGMRDLLEQVGAQIPIALATTKPFTVACKILEALGLYSLFSVVCGPTISERGETKEVTLERAIQELGAVNSKTINVNTALMVGDRSHDIDAARHNGLRVAGVLWGYGSPEELASADYVVSNTYELLSVLQLS